MLIRAMPWALGLGMILVCGTASAQQIEELETEYETDVEYQDQEEMELERQRELDRQREMELQQQQPRDLQTEEELRRQQQMELQRQQMELQQQQMELQQQQQPMPGAEIEADFDAPPPPPVERERFTTPQLEPESAFTVQEPDEVGVTVSVGGGVVGFVDSDARDFAEVGGSWDARLGIGTREFIGAEVAYIGSASDINAFGLDSSAVLVSNGAEAVGRLNFMPVGIANPYLFAGIGWRNYSLLNEDFNTSSVQENDNVGHVPLGAGVGIRVEEVLFDIRGVARPTFADDMMGTEDAALHTLTGEARLGFEF